MQVQIKIQGLEEIVSKLKSLRVKGEEIEGALEEAVGRPLYNATSKAFQTQTSPFGQKWKALNQATLKAKKGRGKILFDRGRLSDSLAMQVSGKTLFVGVNAGERFQYGLSHQFGSKKKNIAARPFLPIDENGLLPTDMIKKIQRNLTEYFSS